MIGNLMILEGAPIFLLRRFFHFVSYIIPTEIFLQRLQGNSSFLLWVQFPMDLREI